MWGIREELEKALRLAELDGEGTMFAVVENGEREKVFRFGSAEKDRVDGENEAGMGKGDDVFADMGFGDGLEELFCASLERGK